MNVASLSLCKELYELSAWVTDKLWVDHEQLGTEVMGLEVENHLGHGIARICPAYDLGYLLRKLPNGVELWKHLDDEYSMRDNPSRYRGSVFRKGYRTPEDAACKLAIELFKQGILK